MNPKTFTLVLLLAPLVYVLSVPPVVMLFEKHPRLSYVDNAGNFAYSLPTQWTDWYAEPYLWLQQRSPLREPLRHRLDDYYNWWAQRLYP